MCAYYTQMKHANVMFLNQDVLPAIVPLHLALIAIELVIGSADKLTFPSANLVTKCSSATMLRRNLNYPLAAGLVPQIAEGSKCITNTHMKYRQTHTEFTYRIFNCSTITRLVTMSVFKRSSNDQ